MLSVFVAFLFLERFNLFDIRLEFVDRLLTYLLLRVIKVVQHCGPLRVPLLPCVFHHLELFLLELLPGGLPLLLGGNLLMDSLEVQFGLVHGVHLYLLESLNAVGLFGDAGLHIHEVLCNSCCIVWGGEGCLKDTAPCGCRGQEGSLTYFPCRVGMMRFSFKILVP